MKPLVSILIPAYNAEPWISDTIYSAFRQTWPRTEIIVVDDGSTDHTRAIADRFAHAGVLVVSQPNLGASAARNKALSLANGDYIQWLDADDILARDKIERQMVFARQSGNNRLLLSSEWGRFLFRTQRAEFTPTDLWRDLSPVEWLVHKLSQNIWMQPGCWLVSRELTEAAGPWDERLSFDDDGEYFCRVISKSDRVAFVRGARTFYRSNQIGSLSAVDGSNIKLDSAWLSIQLQIQHLLRLEDSGRTRKAAIAFLQTWFPMFDGLRTDIMDQMQELAQTLGGTLRRVEMIEPLRWKWALLSGILGRRLAYRAQRHLPQIKHFTIRCWEKTMLQFEKLSP